MAYFIGLDSGTQSTKAVLVSGKDGQVVASAAVSHDVLPASAPGQREQNPRDWVDAASATVSRILHVSKVSLKTVAAIGISGQQHGFVPLDREGRVIRPAKLWCDTTTAAECDLIVERLGGPARTVERLGNGIPPGFTASKILWLKTHEPEHYARLATVLLPHDYLAFWLTGRKTMEYGDASGTALMTCARGHGAAKRSTRSIPRSPTNCRRSPTRARPPARCGARSPPRGASSRRCWCRAAATT
jgi:xylulokinase